MHAGGAIVAESWPGRIGGQDGRGRGHPRSPAMARSS